MILTSQVRLTPGDVEDGLSAARSLLDAAWLEAEHCREPSDPLLLHLKPETSPQLVIHGIRFGVPEGMHPLAEAVKLGESVLEQYRRDGRFLASERLYLLMSLRDIARNKSYIASVDDRLVRLHDADQWKPALYELLTAAAYVTTGAGVELIPESTQPLPDIRVNTASTFYAECKAKLQYEQETVAFVNRWRRHALGTIATNLRNVDAGFLIRVSLEADDEAVLRSTPEIIMQMVQAGEYNRTGSEFSVDIVPFEPTEARPPSAMSAFSAAFWKWAMNFDEWRDWHYVLPGGEFKFSNLSNAIVDAVRRPRLICVRSRRLEDNTQRILPTLRDACRRQFRDLRPGVIHMLINTDLFRLGTERAGDYVETALRSAAAELLRQYTRVWQVVFDVVTPPEWGAYRAVIKRVRVKNSACTEHPATYPEPPPILLW